MDMRTDPTTPSGRQLISSGTVWEDELGSSRAVQTVALAFVIGALAVTVDAVIDS